MKVFFALFILTFTVAGSLAKAEDYRRDVEFEWDSIEGAKSYDLELIQGEKTLKFTTATAAWSGELVPGVYKMRLRARDQRNVPAAWSPLDEFKVNLEAVKIKSPKASEKIKTDESETTKITFEWEPVGGAQSYHFEISSDDGVFQKSEDLNETQLSLKLPVAKVFSWKVKAVSALADSDEPEISKVTLIGKKLSKPEIDTPENQFVRQLKWKAPELAETYSYQIQRFNPKTKAWEKVDGRFDTKETEIVFDPKWPGGKYKLALVAHANLREPSPITQETFQVRYGDRSPAAEEIVTLRQSIDRLTGWYAIASYLLTVVDYHGVDYEKNSRLSYSTVGGTGRLGAGYVSPRSGWGFLGVADMSGMTVDNENYTYACLEGNAVHSMALGSRGELRQQMGLRFKEFPETVGKSVYNITEKNIVQSLGAHYGVAYGLALTPKLGVQVNLHLYPNLIKIKTPNDGALRPTLSSQFGILGSYRLRPNLTGLAGYVYWNDKVEYEAIAGRGAALSGDTNSIQITGHYLNLSLEWAL